MRKVFLASSCFSSLPRPSSQSEDMSCFAPLVPLCSSLRIAVSFLLQLQPWQNTSGSSYSHRQYEKDRNGKRQASHNGLWDWGGCVACRTTILPHFVRMPMRTHVPVRHLYNNLAEVSLRFRPSHILSDFLCSSERYPCVVVLLSSDHRQKKRLLHRLRIIH